VQWPVNLPYLVLDKCFKAFRVLNKQHLRLFYNPIWCLFSKTGIFKSMWHMSQIIPLCNMMLNQEYVARSCLFSTDVYTMKDMCKQAQHTTDAVIPNSYLITVPYPLHPSGRPLSTYSRTMQDAAYSVINPLASDCSGSKPPLIDPSATTFAWQRGLCHVVVYVEGSKLYTYRGLNL